MITFGIGAQNCQIEGQIIILHLKCSHNINHCTLIPDVNIVKKLPIIGLKIR